MKKVVGERIRIFRVSLGLSQEYVANELDLSKGAYSNIETGRSDVTITRLYKIAQIFKVEPTELLPTENKYPVDSISSTKLLEKDIKQLRVELRELKNELHEMQNKK